MPPILLYIVAPLFLPEFSTPEGELNAFVVVSITSLGYLFEFFLARRVLRKEGYALRSCSLKERINWHWPRGWKAWGLILILFGDARSLYSKLWLHLAIGHSGRVRRWLAAECQGAFQSSLRIFATQFLHSAGTMGTR
jgi:hypothetical protein